MNNLKGDNTSRPHGIGERFQEETKYDPETITGHMLDWNNVPEPFKNYDAPIERIKLPDPVATGNPNIWHALQTRRSRRVYLPELPLKQSMLSVLLWATQGITAEYGDTLLRTAPSAGGLYPVETYLHIRNVEDLGAGIYHFRPHIFDLEYLKQGDFGKRLSEAALGQSMVQIAQVTFIWSAILARSKWKYRERAYRYIYLDAGHIGQNLYLAGTALELGVCAIGAFYDNAVNAILELDGVKETVIYMATVGWPDRREFEIV